MNLKTEEAEFTLNRGRLTVNGSFITEAHLVARIGAGGRKWANLSFWASELNEDNWGWKNVNGTCDGRFVKLGKGGAKKCEELSISLGMSSATFTAGNWTATVRDVVRCSEAHEQMGGRSAPAGEGVAFAFRRSLACAHAPSRGRSTASTWGSA